MVGVSRPPAENLARIEPPSPEPAEREAVRAPVPEPFRSAEPVRAAAPEPRATRRTAQPETPREPPPTEEARLDIPPSPRQASIPSTTQSGLMAPLTHNGKIVAPPLRGSYDSLVHQNQMSEAEGLERIQDDADLSDRIAQKLLVPVPVSANLAINQDLPAMRRYCRPWTAKFLADLARAHAAEFHRPLMVSSAVRTVEYQKRLERVNGNAAPAEGDVVSPHVTGATIDIAKEDMNRRQLAWMRSRLLALELAGKIDVEEEFQQSCFHITVYKSYVPPPAVPARKRRRAEAPATIASLGR
jgi:hypothetical protein